MDAAASNGHLDLLKYLHSIGSICTKRAMDQAAGDGHLDVVKFLHDNRYC
jgi:ankyrin repeat protein